MAQYQIPGGPYITSIDGLQLQIPGGPFLVSLATVSVPTIGRPGLDLVVGDWASSNGGSLSSCIGEEVPDAASFISVSSASMCEVALNPTEFPGTANQAVSYYADSALGSTLTVRLRQGGSTIAQWSHALTSTLTLYEQTLTAPQIAALASGSVSVQLETS